MRTRSWTIPIVLAAALALPGVARVRSQERPVFSSQAELVVLHVTVRDRKGAYVGGLPLESFAVVEDGRAQTVSLFSDTDTPVTVGLLVDASASMYANRELAIAGAAAFAEASHPDDEIFGLAFNEVVNPVLTSRNPFTSDGSVLRTGLERAMIARGRTALYDAISAGVDYLARGSRERKALVVLSDGGDNASRTERDAAVRKAQASNAVIYTIALVEPGERGANPELLADLSRASGGEAFRPHSAHDLADVLRKIALDIRHVYTIGYTPTNTTTDGTYRRVRVVVSAPPGRPLVVRSREGYVAGKTAQP